MTSLADHLTRDIIATIEARLPKDATSTDVEQIRSNALKLLQTAAKLRSFPLTNSDEPDPIFHPYRRPD